MRGVLGGCVCICVGLTASATTAETIAPITTALAVELPAADTSSAVSPPLFRKLPLPRMRPASAPKPPEPNSPQDVCETIAASAQKHRLPIAFFGNLIYQESGLKPRVVSRAGARGIAQFMPKTARSVGLKDPFNPRQALPASAKFLRGLMHRFGNNYGLAAAAYNAGPGRVSRWLKRGGALPKETRNYVVTITGKRAEQWKGARTHGFDHNLSGRIPCSNLKAYAELENNPASLHSLRPVKFVLPVPLPHPLRPMQHAALVTDGEPQMTVNLEMKLPIAQTPNASPAPADMPTASIAIVLPTPQVARRALDAPKTGEDTAASEPKSELKAAAPVVATLDSDVSMVALITNPPTPRRAPRRLPEPVAAEPTPDLVQVTALGEPTLTMIARIKNAPTPRPSPRRPGDQTTEAAVEPAVITTAPLPRAHPRRAGDDVAKVSEPRKLPLPRAHPMRSRKV
jgi:hypothetical protein